MITRRSFLKLGGAAAASIALLPSDLASAAAPERPALPVYRARVAANTVYRYAQPSFKSERLGTLRRDQLIRFYEETISLDGPSYNPRWYRLSNGFVHSGHLQRIDLARPHFASLPSIPEAGQLGEICVPFTRSYRKLRLSGWTELYRLYYQSVHWITGIETGPDGEAWYRLTDDLLHAHHYVSARHVRPIAAEEFTPISPHVPADKKRIQVSIEEQSLTAFEGDQVVLKTLVSTGIPSDPQPGLLPTETPRGRFRVQTKMPSRHMGDGNLTSDLDAYELPGVPWVCFFHKDGIALHGTYWHDNFGRMMSHGCINLRNEDAQWIYRWTNPVAASQDWYVREMGTVIDIV